MTASTSTTVIEGTISQPIQKEWSPSSWRQKKAKQQPVYADQAKYEKALEKLGTLPPLVTASEVPNRPQSGR
jgi:3-deoxy-7-phosphoheptulonate synthase